MELMIKRLYENVSLLNGLVAGMSVFFGLCIIALYIEIKRLKAKIDGLTKS